ncbi:hypothetical protein DL771_004165 [Monosporascus sp. 5C6A]|nr:hypothetical protein DL771_004165 [Monosporascus sp. 5C6A]
MAQGRKSTRRGVWDDDMDTELLAFLDYCITRNVKFYAAVTGHMKRTTGKDLSLRQSIKLRVHYLRKKYSMGHVERANFMEQGTSCLPGLPPEQRVKIEQAKNRIPYPLPRSAAGIDAAQPSGFQESSFQARNLHTSLPSTAEVVSQRKAAQTDIQSLETPTENKHAETRSVWDVRSSGRSFTSGRWDSPSDERATAVQSAFTERHAPGKMLPPIEYNGTGAIGRDQSVNESAAAVLETLGRQNRAQGTQTESALNLGNEYAEFQEKYENLQRRCKELERLSQPGNGTQRMQGDGNQVLDDEYGDLRGQHEELDRRCEDLQETSHSESAALKKTIEDLRILTSRATQRVMGRITGAGEISALKNSIGDREISESEILRKFSEVPEHGIQEILRSLAFAYVGSVVFEDPFPDVFQAGTPLQDLLDNRTDGPDALRSMDVLAHEAWMSERKFVREVLYKKSRRWPAVQPHPLHRYSS